MPLLATTIGLTQPEHGYVLAVGVATALINFWHGVNTGQYRRAAQIAYPTCYASTEEADKNPAAKRFNCAQRAHGNFVENLPTFLILLGTAGITYPVLSAASGVVYLVGKVVYTIGYSTGEPKQRSKGSFAYLGMIALLGMSVATVYKTITA